MSLMRSLKRKAKGAVPPLLFLSLVGYFWWHAVNGDRGLKSIVIRQQELETARAELAQANADRVAWEHRVAGLQSNHLDPDTLDERARAMLNMAEPDDVVMPYPKGERLF